MIAISSKLDKERVLAFLRKGAWFGRMPAQLQTALVDAGHVRTFERSEEFGSEDRPSRGLFVILQGQALITRHTGIEAQSVMHLGGPGYWVGYIGLLTHGVLAVTATAQTRMRVLHLYTSRFHQLTDERPEYFRHFAELAAQQLAFVLRQLACSMTMSAEDWLRLRLADFATMWHNDGVDDDVIELALSQDEVSRMVGASRQTVNRCLAHLEQQGLIEVGFHSIRILDPVGLRQGQRLTGLEWA